jgi:hypothetical protein
MDALVSEDARLREQWDALRQTHAHLHPPDAARLIGVSESRLMQARSGGYGSHRLDGDVAARLQQMAQWGRCLIAIRCGLGVALGFVEQPDVRCEGPWLQVNQGPLSIGLALDGIAETWLFEENDGHGHTISLNAFDARGDAVHRVFLMSKSQREPWVEAWQSAPEQDRANSVGTLPDPDALPDGPRVTHRVDELLLAGEDGEPRLLRMSGPGGELTFKGALGKRSASGGAVHASNVALRLHLRPAQQQLAWITQWQGCSGLGFAADPASGAVFLDWPASGGRV